MFLLEQELEDQKEVNKQLKAYVGDVLINIIVQNPDILEKKSQQWNINIEIKIVNYLTLVMGKLLKQLLVHHNNKMNDIQLFYTLYYYVLHIRISEIRFN